MKRYRNRPLLQELRTAVFMRDLGICSQCGFDCEALRRRLRRMNAVDRRLEHLRLGIAPGRIALWESHHRTPVCEGGRDTLGNLVTLCVPCHTKATAKLAADRAAARKPKRIPSALEEVYG